MTGVKTELATVEEHDSATRLAIERRAYRLYERGGFTDGHEEEHWLKAEQDLTLQDVPYSIEDNAVSIRLSMDDIPDSTLVISIAARSVLIFSRKNDDVNQERQAIEQDWLHILSLRLKSTPHGSLANWMMDTST